MKTPRLPKKPVDGYTITYYKVNHTDSEVVDRKVIYGLRSASWWVKERGVRRDLEQDWSDIYFWDWSCCFSSRHEATTNIIKQVQQRMRFHHEQIVRLARDKARLTGPCLITLPRIC
jgi:hypothetical protein